MRNDRPRALAAAMSWLTPGKNQKQADAIAERATNDGSRHTVVESGDERTVVGDVVTAANAATDRRVD
jgi:hypothetical protein